MSTHKKIHIGKIIKQKVEDSAMTIQEFADKIDCERSTVYHLFKLQSIDIEKLEKRSKALDYDFMFEVYKYKKQKDKTRNSPQTVFIAVETDIEPDFLQQLNLSEYFIRLIKKQE
jgi:predicted transcriptional regulator